MEMYTRFVPGVHIGSSGRSSFFIIRVPMISPTEQIRSNAAMIPARVPAPELLYRKPLLSDSRDRSR